MDFACSGPHFLGNLCNHVIMQMMQYASFACYAICIICMLCKWCYWHYDNWYKITNTAMIYFVGQAKSSANILNHACGLLSFECGSLFLVWLSVPPPLAPLVRHSYQGCLGLSLARIWHIPSHAWPPTLLFLGECAAVAWEGGGKVFWGSWLAFSLVPL